MLADWFAKVTTSIQDESKKALVHVSPMSRLTTPTDILPNKIFLQIKVAERQSGRGPRCSHTFGFGRPENKLQTRKTRRQCASVPYL